jgi:hypothetical protein
MSYEVYITPSFVEDFFDSLEFIEGTLWDLPEKLRDSAILALSELRENPDWAASTNITRDLGSVFRKKITDSNFEIYYRVEEMKLEVVGFTILHSKEDLPNILRVINQRIQEAEDNPDDMITLESFEKSIK